MEEIKNLITRYKPELEQITVSTYARRINTMLKKGIDFTYYDDTMYKLRELYELKTIKSCITAIVTFLKASRGDEKLISRYSAVLLETGEKISNQEYKNEPSRKEQDNFITRKEIEDIILKLRMLIADEKRIEGNKKLFDLCQQYLVINLYYLIPPLRNDFVGVLVDNTRTMNDQYNYIRLGDGELILNRYKTRKIYGKNNSIKLPEKLVKIIRKWINIRGRIYPELVGHQDLLLNQNLIPMSQVNLTQFLNKIFKRKISSTMLRKSYISEKYPVVHTTEDMIKDAKSMQHSVSMQQSTYRKK